MDNEMETGPYRRGLKGCFVKFYGPRFLIIMIMVQGTSTYALNFNILGV